MYTIHFQWGSKRTGLRPGVWVESTAMNGIASTPEQPRDVVPESNMPAYSGWEHRIHRMSLRT